MTSIAEQGDEASGNLRARTAATGDREEHNHHHGAANDAGERDERNGVDGLGGGGLSELPWCAPVVPEPPLAVVLEPLPVRHVTLLQELRERWSSLLDASASLFRGSAVPVESEHLRQFGFIGCTGAMRECGVPQCVPLGSDARAPNPSATQPILFGLEACDPIARHIAGRRATPTPQVEEGWPIGAPASTARLGARLVLHVQVGAVANMREHRLKLHVRCDVVVHAVPRTLVEVVPPVLAPSCNARLFSPVIRSNC
eukprot:CAMPEP_0204584732 /NCGR_PEP_ID=MMETSP0661-20131031/46506_1 /ASSEMBLY_ACC=CAM_ASM_000606 /TAXON_ID=109239 /ORGANISM="Alexandrium margalefi, Strain AMGDE01CS-322" /LENGTH=256 /DNA_ID=CAMNT_0051594207 /DNA_START=251 /DNA_END=1022 /DNA_ORIENTATION=+